MSKEEIINALYERGGDWDGDTIFIDGKVYYVDVSNDIVEEIG